MALLGNKHLLGTYHVSCVILYAWHQNPKINKVASVEKLIHWIKYLEPANRQMLILVVEMQQEKSTDT